MKSITIQLAIVGVTMPDGTVTAGLMMENPDPAQPPLMLAHIEGVTAKDARSMPAKLFEMAAQYTKSAAEAYEGGSVATQPPGLA